MKHAVLCLSLLAVLLVPAARADDAKTTAMADELVNLAELEKNYEQSFTMVKQTLAKQMGATLGTASAGEKSGATQNADAIFDMIAKQLDWASVRKDYVALYASTFTEGELQGIIDFYKSEAGQAFVKKQPELMKKSMDLTQSKMAEIMPKIQQLIMQQSTKGTQVPRPPAK